MVHLLDGEEGVLGRSLEAVVEGKGLPWEGNEVVAAGDDHRGDLQVREVVPESVIGAAAHFCHHGAAIVRIESDDGLYLSPQPVGVGHHGGVEYSGTTHRVPYECHRTEVHMVVDGAVRPHALTPEDLVGSHQPGRPLEGALLVQGCVYDADKSVRAQLLWELLEKLLLAIKPMHDDHGRHFASLFQILGVVDGGRLLLSEVLLVVGVVIGIRGEAFFVNLCQFIYLCLCHL